MFQKKIKKKIILIFFDTNLNLILIKKSESSDKKISKHFIFEKLFMLNNFFLIFPIFLFSLKISQKLKYISKIKNSKSLKKTLIPFTKLITPKNLKFLKIFY